ncbi:hypothetical protein L6452_38847 [Arctium lappa]|uniref:Uncharacterized protein n=1 Tax=Arctium lappa TaxID=4217 RepID=A0ACB8XQW7_ARCLA|nr:hypothetical protein L6452_38847 [Arctium lappa]
METMMVVHQDLQAKLKKEKSRVAKKRQTNFDFSKEIAGNKNLIDSLNKAATVFEKQKACFETQIFETVSKFNKSELEKQEFVVNYNKWQFENKSLLKKLNGLEAKPYARDCDQKSYQKKCSKKTNDFKFPNSSKAQQFDDDDIFEDVTDFLNADGCFDERIDKFDFNAKLPDHTSFVINNDSLPSVFEKGETSTKVDESISVSTYYSKELRRKKSEARVEWGPKRKVEESMKSFSDTDCNRTFVSHSDVLGHIASHKTKLTCHMWYLDSGCSKHMTRQKYILSNYTEKFCSNVRFGNDQFSPILGYRDIVQENITIKKVSYVEGLGHNMFSIGQFCDIDLKLVTGNLVKGLPELKYEKEHMCDACEKEKMKRDSHNPKPEPSTSTLLELLHMYLCGPMRTQSINGKKYVLVIVDDFSRYTWVKFRRSKDETLEIIISFLKTIQVNLQKIVKLI